MRPTYYVAHDANREAKKKDGKDGGPAPPATPPAALGPALVAANDEPPPAAIAPGRVQTTPLLHVPRFSVLTPISYYIESISQQRTPRSRIFEKSWKLRRVKRDLFGCNGKDWACPPTPPQHKPKLEAMTMTKCWVIIMDFNILYALDSVY